MSNYLPDEDKYSAYDLENMLKDIYEIVESLKNELKEGIDYANNR